MASKAAASLLIKSAGRNSFPTTTRSLVSNIRLLSSATNGQKTSSFNVRNVNCVSETRGMATLSAGQTLKSLSLTHPNMDVVRYHHKNVKWSFKQMEYFSDALACGFLEQGLLPGDIVLSWLPSHLSELHVLQFTCSKAGFVLYNLDPAQAITDPEGAKSSLKHALEITEANILVSQDAGDDTNYVQLVKDVIPEIRIFDFSEGMPFITPRFPHLRFPMHTGFEIDGKVGMVPLKHMLCPTDQLDTWLEGHELTGSTPLLGEFVMKDGLPSLGRVMTNDEVVKEKAWPIISSILTKDYQEVEGVGVIF